MDVTIVCGSNALVCVLGDSELKFNTTSPGSPEVRAGMEGLWLKWYAGSYSKYFVVDCETCGSRMVQYNK